MKTKPEWKEYTGSDEQIAEMRETTNGFILRYSTGVQTEIFKRIGSSYVGEYIDSRRRLLSRNYSWARLTMTEESRKAMELRNESITRTITVLSDSFKNNCDTPLHKASF